jgi:hypothetical protein
MEKDQKEIITNKTKLIEEIKSLDKNEMFKVPVKEKIGFFKKLAIIFGNGKKR